MRWKAETPEGVHFTVESDRWYEARKFAKRYGCKDVSEVTEPKEPADFVLEWQGSDAKAIEGLQLVVVEREPRLGETIEKARKAPEERWP